MSIWTWLFGGQRRTEPVNTTVETAAGRRADWMALGELRKSNRPRTRTVGRVKWREGSFPMEVVGESYYQPALQCLCGAPTRLGCDLEFDAVIELEPSNPHDRNAVVVRIQDRIVGHLPRDQARRVGDQMRADGLASAVCRARVREGQRSNQYEDGIFWVTLAINQWDWIDFGIGKARPDEPVGRGQKPKPVRPKEADAGPLKGERVAVLGEPGDGELAHKLAALGAHIMAGPGKTTTMLVLAGRGKPDAGMLRSATYAKAKDLIDHGAQIEIISEGDLKNRLSLP